MSIQDNNNYFYVHVLDSNFCSVTAKIIDIDYYYFCLS